jgi:acetyl esterase/lipase
VISVEYRLAPEHPFPASPDDCYDVAEYLVDNALSTYGGPLKFIGGESAGSNLTALTTLHLLDTRPNFSLAGVILNYGIFDLSLLPCARTWTNPLILTTKSINHFYDAYLPNMSPNDRRDPAISPMYHPIFQYPGSQLASAAKYPGKKPRLPPALFLCGTQDAVLDDQVLMSFKWQIGGGEARIKFIEGAPHAFLLLDANQFNITAEGRNLMIDFALEKF